MPGTATIIGIAALVAFSAGVLGYALLGTTARYMADDYWTAYVVKTTPFWQLPGFWYSHWSGRYSFFGLVSLAELAGVRIVPLLPGLTLAGLVASSALLGFTGLRRLPLHNSRAGAWLAALIFVFTTIHSTQNVLQSLYWQTGMLTYFAPILVFVIYLVWVSYFSRRLTGNWRWLGLPVSALLAFVCGGFSETSVAIQVTFFTLALAFILAIEFIKPPAFSGRRSDRWSWAAVGLGASLLAMGVMILAPGNLVRLGGSSIHLDLIYVIKTSLNAAFHYLLSTLRTYWLDAVTAVFIPAFGAFFWLKPAAPEEQKRLERLSFFAMLSIPCAVFFLIVAGNAPAYTIMRSGPPIRTEIIAQAILTAGLMGWGGAAGLVARFRTSLPNIKFSGLEAVTMLIIAALLLAGPGRFMLKAATQYPVLRGYAAQWDARDRLLREGAKKGQSTAVVTVIGQLDQSLGDLRGETDFWINQRAAEYYGLKSISAK